MYVLNLGVKGLTAVALTQISAYSTHKNLTVRKIMEVLRTAYAKIRDSVSTRLKLHTRLTIMEHMRVRERKARIVCEEHYISLNLKGAFEMRQSFLYFFSLVRISEFLYANFSSTCVRCTHLLKS